MEQKQLQRIKITATNIKSVLISKNKKIVKLDRTKSVLVERTKEEQRRKQMEANVEKSNLGPVKKVFASISTPGKSFLSKVLDFFGFIIAGYLVKYLPNLVKGIGDFINFIKPIWNTFTKVLGFIGNIIRGLFNVFNPRKTEREINNLDKELKAANADADQQLDEMGDVARESKKESTEQGSVEAATSDNKLSKFDSNSADSSPKSGVPIQNLNEGGTVMDPMNFDSLPSLGGGGGGTDAITMKSKSKSLSSRTKDIGKVLFQFGLLRDKTKTTDYRSQFASSMDTVNGITDSSSLNMKSTPITRSIKPSNHTQLVTDHKKRPKTIVMTVEREVEVSSGNSNMTPITPKLPAPLPSSSTSMRIP